LSARAYLPNPRKIMRAGSATLLIMSRADQASAAASASTTRV
jgi:hypothetical protein